MSVTYWPPESKHHHPDLVTYLPGGPDQDKINTLGNRPKRRLKKMRAAGYTYQAPRSPLELLSPELREILETPNLQDQETTP